MQTNLISYKTNGIVLAVAGFALSLQAIPITISREISLSSTTTIDSTSFVTAARFTSFPDVFVGAPSAWRGDYVGTSETASTPINSLWTLVSDGNHDSLDLSVLHEGYALPTGLLLAGLGSAHITGSEVDKTGHSGQLEFRRTDGGRGKLQLPNHNPRVTAQSVPDGGSTVAMFGAAVLGLGWIKRKLIV